MDNGENKDLQGRREFFKEAAKKALPILGAVALMSNPIIVRAVENESMGCNSDCYGSCYGGCEGCKSTCNYGCFGGCERSCKSDCAIGCKGQSTNSADNCYGCNSYCMSSCSGSCRSDCDGSCKGGSYKAN